MDPARDVYWARKLRPILLGAEPVEEQLSRSFYGMIVISAVTSFIGLFVLAIFAAFGRADIGLLVVGESFLPGTLWFWLDYSILRRRTLAYLREKSATDRAEAPPS
jgi:hypothetical protein